MRDLPYSNRIEDYLEAIEGCDAFFVADRDYGRIINYRQMGADVFPDPAAAPDEHTARLWGLRRQCRGIIFNLVGDVISPGFEKFMNINECEETQAHMIDLGQPHVICEKLDGSMIRPIPMPTGGYRLGTKMGITDVSAQPEAWIQHHDQYDRLIRDLLAEGWVPLFEWCSRQQRIVVDYPEDRLVLLAIRNVQDGSYMPLGMMLELAGEYGVDVVRRYEGTVHNMEHLMQDTRDLQGQEGWVIWFANGYRVKLKGQEYVQIHRAKDQILRENALIQLVLDQTLDDVKSFLPDADREAVCKYETDFWSGVNATAHDWQQQFAQIRAKYGDDRKAFALGDAVSLNGHVRAAMFQAWSDAAPDWEQMVVNVIRKNTGTGVKTDQHRWLWGSHRWNAVHMGDE